MEECETVEAAMRQIEFLDAEVAEVERLIARDILWSADTRILLSVPGVNLICAATFLAAIGDIRRFPTSRKLVAYLGPGPEGPPVRLSSPRGPVGSLSKDPRRRGGRWSKRPTAWSDSPARCARFTNASARVVARTSRPSPPRASSPACSGVC